MVHQIDRLYVSLRSKLAEVEARMNVLKAKIDAETQQAQQDAQQELGKLRMHIEKDRSKISAAQAEIKRWIEQKKATTNEKIAEWKAKRETSKLQDRAEDAERYAVIAADVAFAAIEEAEVAALEAVLARRDTDSARSERLA